MCISFQFLVLLRKALDVSFINSKLSVIGFWYQFYKFNEINQLIFLDVNIIQPLIVL